MADKRNVIVDFGPRADLILEHANKNRKLISLLWACITWIVLGLEWQLTYPAQPPTTSSRKRAALS